MPPAASSTKKSPSLKQLTTRLKDTQASLLDIWNFIEDFKEDSTVSQVNVRLEKLDELWEKFSETLVEIKSHDDFTAEEEAYGKERREFNNRYYEAKSFLMDKVKEREECPALEQSTRGFDTSVHGALDHVRLPQIRLQSFNGDIDDWLSFRDLFTSLIHWKADLPEVEKFHYLKGCLQGEPKNLIDPLKITKANYQVAWEMLLKRYNNSKQLKKRQVQSLLALPTLSKESVARLDPVTRRGWEEFSAANEQDILADLTDFLHRRVRVLESLPSKPMDTRGVQQPNQLPKQKPPQLRINSNTAQASVGRCAACSSNHPLFQCSTFQRLSVSDRDAILKTHSLCRNCFRTGHQAKGCQSKYSCRNCKGRHHTLVCFKSGRERDTNGSTDNSSSSKEPSTSTSSQVANMAATNISTCNAAHESSSQVLLATAVVMVEDDEGNQYPARALLDSGSESNFITERLCQRLKVTRDKVDISVLGIGQAATRVKHRIRAMVRSRISKFSRDLGFLVLPKVTVNLPTSTIKIDAWSIPNGIELADPTFFESKGVDMVLGIENFFDFFETGRRISLGEQQPTLNHSVFASTEGLDALMERFWASEDIGSSKAYSLEENRCEELFQQTVRREEDGRYTVALPKNEDVLLRLGESRDIAFRRLQGTERRLARDAKLREQYNAFMEEYLRLGHMRKVEQATLSSVRRCYLPHHPVVKEASTTTKVRVVFDASCKTSSGVSLNDVLLVGPVIQDDLRSIVLRCRTRQIMLVSDVEKMFRQINLRPEDRPLQCILWRAAPGEEVEVYELNTVTYGTKPAPFLATRTLKQLATEEEGRFPLAARAVNEDTYMDDVITGSNDVETALEMRFQLDKMMSRGGFKLRKWASNCSKVLDDISPEDLAIRDSEEVSLDPTASVKTLDLTWLPKPDVLRFQFNIPELEEDTKLSKRQILSVIATLFDPLGLLGAAITTAKIFMQRLWTLQDENGGKTGMGSAATFHGG
ncbi:uncharacterized protein LOC131696380 [Topomyia yanbarensis]|uniref:uncharacterized protein LOC131696380 n=1 Tax=Topomyia yanbarensis TaxID=2498891 RepID=UPI00273BE299|nr:uncharacterized protein LOC131696380 [Topomyia yanbarensis]